MELQMKTETTEHSNGECEIMISDRNLFVFLGLFTKDTSLKKLLGIFVAQYGLWLRHNLAYLCILF
jgi:hypothetical protein